MRRTVGSWDTSLVPFSDDVRDFRSVYAFTDACFRRIAKSWRSVRRELRWTASLLPSALADLRRPWYDTLFFGDASMAGHGICERRCPERKFAEIGRQSERWRWDVEEAIRAREHALKPRTTKPSYR